MSRYGGPGDAEGTGTGVGSGEFVGIAVAAAVAVGATGVGEGDSVDGVAVESAALGGVSSIDGDGACTDVDANATTEAGGAVGGTSLVQPTASSAATATEHMAGARTDISASSFSGVRRRERCL